MMVSILHPYVFDVGILLGVCEIKKRQVVSGGFWRGAQQPQHAQRLNRKANAANVTSNTGTVNNTPTLK